MKALVLECKLIKISYTFDAMTLYTNDDTVAAEFKSATATCSKLSFLHQTNPSLVGLNRIIDLCGDIKHASATQRKEFDRFVYWDEGDHNLYHQDGLDKDRVHYHMKFKDLITRDQLIEILDILVNYHLATQEDKLQWLQKFDDRYSTEQKKLGKALTQHQITDTNAIIQFIHHCDDIDILINLHDYLLDTPFDYLRELPTTTGLNAKKWQGTNKLGQWIESSEQWAMIEKAISLQLLNIIKVNCNPIESIPIKQKASAPPFFFSVSTSVKNDRCHQFSNSFSFFKGKRTLGKSIQQGNAMGYFAKGKMSEFAVRHEKHFNKFK